MRELETDPLAPATATADCPEERPKGASRAERAGTGLFARRQAERISREELVRRARLLPTLPQALLLAYFDHGMTLEQLAALHCMPQQRMYRTLMHWRDILSDRSFLLAAHFAGRLRPRLADLARHHWMEGRTLRQLARARHATIYEVRTLLAEARAELIAAAARLRREFDAPGARGDGGTEPRDDPAD
jgi:hypothetical protein